MSLGSGSFGDVYKSKLNGETIAVKEYKDLVDYNEIDIMSSRDHKNIMRVKTLIVEKDVVKIGMDLGYPTQTPDLDKSKIVFDLCQGIEYLHRCGILHCDIKIANTIMVGNTAKIIDFGLCVQGNPEMLQSGVRSLKEKYTYLHKAPEVAYMGWDKQVPIISTKSDVFALGWAFVNLFNHLFEVPKKKDYESMLRLYFKLNGLDPKNYNPKAAEYEMKKILADGSLTSYLYHHAVTKDEQKREDMIQSIVPQNTPHRDVIVRLMFGMLAWNPNHRPEMRDVVMGLMKEGLIEYERGEVAMIIGEQPPKEVKGNDILRLRTLVPELDVCYLMMILELNSKLTQSVVKNDMSFDYATAYVFSGLCPMVGHRWIVDGDEAIPNKSIDLFDEIMENTPYWNYIVKEFDGVLATSNAVYNKCKNESQLKKCIQLYMQGYGIEDILETIDTRQTGSKILSISEIVDSLQKDE